jgi:hypothetical protein
MRCVMEGILGLDDLTVMIEGGMADRILYGDVWG